MYLLDTGVVWELRLAKPTHANRGVAAWASAIPRTSLFLSAISLSELVSGAARLARRDKVAGSAVRAWIDTQVTAAFDGRILPVDAAVVRRWSRMADADARDGLLAATALEHGLTIATRHMAAFKAGKVKTLNPWAYTAEASDESSDWRLASRAAPLWLKSLFVRT